MTGRSFVARALVALGVVFATAGLLAVFVRLTALDDNEARTLAHALIIRPDLRAEVASTSVDRLYANVDVAGQLRKRLPAGERGLAGPLSAALRGVAEQGVVRLLAQPSVQSLWTDAVYRAHRELVAIIEKKSQAGTVSNGRAILDLRPIVLRAGERVGIGANLARILPTSAGQITVFRSNDLASAQVATRVLNAVADWLWVVAIAAWAVAIWIARAARRSILRAIAVGLVLVGTALLALRSIAGHYVAHSLVPVDWARPLVSITWSVLTARLADSGWTTIGVGVVALVGLWLQGSARAHRVRLALAPVLGAPELAFGLLGGLLFLLHWWGPTIETREWRGVALIAVGSAVGLEILRRTTAREFPGTSLDEAWASLRKRVTVPSGHGDDVDRLERLARLHESGALSDEEFTAAKRKLLGLIG
jgi:putative oligomerization/nucleic acid binding protein